MQMSVKNVDPIVFREFKADVIRRGLKLGTAITLAMENFRAELYKKKQKFSDHKPISWGKGTERVSEQIDEILYS